MQLRKAACLALKGDTLGAAAGRAEADRVPPGDTFDLFLSGRQQYKDRHWPQAIQLFEAALRQKPDHFWSQCLLAICYVQSGRPDAAKSCLNACLQTEPDLAWLYLLRGFAERSVRAESWPVPAPARSEAALPVRPGRGRLPRALDRLGTSGNTDLRSTPCS